MTKAEIVAKRATITDWIAAVNGELEHARLELKILQTRCPHPDKFKTSHMGESCVDCPDCGACVS